MTDKMVKIDTHCEEREGLKYEPPKLCPSCGADLRPKYVVEGSMGPHLRVDVAPGFCLYQCFSCNTILGNVHLRANIKQLQQRETAGRIFRPENRLVTLQ